MLRRSTHVWNGLDLLTSAEPVEPAEPGTIDITDADFAHTQELMKMLDEEIEIASTSTEPPPAREAPPQPARAPLRRLA